MSVGRALRLSLVDFYHHSWRLLVLNTVLSIVLIAVLVVALFAPLALVLVLLLGPLAAALMHCAVTLAQTDDLALRDAAIGLRLHWRRGFALAMLAGFVAVVGLVAVTFYGRAGAVAWPLGAAVLYLLLGFYILQLHLWPLAIHERERPLTAVLRSAFFAMLRRPAASVGFGLALLLVNTLGFAAAILPFLTLTIAYSFLAAAHFALPPSPIREA